MSKETIFEYKFSENDSTIKEIRDKESFYGCCETKPLSFDSSYEDLFYSIRNDESILGNVFSPSFFVNKKYVKNSISLWESLGIQLQDIDILDKYYPMDSHQGEVTQDFLDALSASNPAQLPIVFKWFNDVEAKVVSFEMKYNNPDNYGLIFQKIILPIFNSKLTSCFYAHEIAHTQPVIMSSLLNDETIPILVEEIFASILDPSSKTLKQIRYRRLNQLMQMLYILANVKNISFESKIIYDTYIQSTLQAIKLANTYLFGTSSLQREIIKYINQIFQGNLFIEEMLAHFEANLEDVPRDINMLKMVK